MIEFWTFAYYVIGGVVIFVAGYILIGWLRLKPWKSERLVSEHATARPCQDGDEMCVDGWPCQIHDQGRVRYTEAELNRARAEAWDEGYDAGGSHVDEAYNPHRAESGGTQ